MSRRKEEEVHPKMSSLNGLIPEGPEEERPVISAEDAQKFLAQDRDQRVALCRQLIAQALQNCNCQLDVVTTIRGNQIRTEIIIIG
jgi:hypothetical protein